MKKIYKAFHKRTKSTSDSVQSCSSPEQSSNLLQQQPQPCVPKSSLTGNKRDKKEKNSVSRGSSSQENTSRKPGQRWRILQRTQRRESASPLYTPPVPVRAAVISSSVTATVPQTSQRHQEHHEKTLHQGSNQTNGDRFHKEDVQRIPSEVNLPTPSQQVQQQVQQQPQQPLHKEYGTKLEKQHILEVEHRRNSSQKEEPQEQLPRESENQSPSLTTPSQSNKNESKKEKDKLLRKDSVRIKTKTAKVIDIDKCNKVTAEVAALDKDGSDLFAKGNYQEAFKRFEKALLLKRQSLHDHSVAFEKFEEKSNNESLQGKMASRHRGDAKSIESDDNCPSVDTLSSLTILKSHPTYKATKNLNTSKLTNSDVDEYKKNLIASVATSINNMTYLKQQNGQSSTEETLASYMQALQMKLEVLGPEHLSVGKTLNNIGSVFYVQRKYPASLQAYLDAFGIMKKALGETHLDVATVASNIGDAYRCMGDSDVDAVKYYRLALDIRWKLLPHNHPKIARLMEQTADLELKQDDTFRRPRRNSLSDSDNDDGDVVGCSTISEIKSLKATAEEDMKFIVELERQAFQDIKDDSATFTREIKQLETEIEPDDAPVVMMTKCSLTNSEGNFDQRPVLVTPEKVDTTISSEESDHNDVVEHTTETADLNMYHHVDSDSEDFHPISSSSEKPLVDLEDEDLIMGSKNLLSAEDRQNALISVRERLEKIRSTRDQPNDRNRGLGTSQHTHVPTKPISHRSYMNPTQASAAKATILK